MAFNTFALYVLGLALSNIQPARSQGAEICVDALDPFQWLLGGMTRQATIFGQDQADEIGQIGYQPFLINTVGGAVAEDYTCGGQGKCDLTLLNEACTGNPIPATLLKALANWSNFWQDAIANMGAAFDIVRDGSGTLEQAINPALEFPPPGAVARANEAQLDPMLAQVLTSVIFTTYPPVVEARGLVGTPSDFADLVEEIVNTVLAAADNPDNTGGYNEFADINPSVEALRLASSNGLRQYIDNKLGSTNVFAEDGGGSSNIALIIAPGLFSAPLPGPANTDQIVATVAAPGINRIWNERQVVVLRITANDVNGNAVFPEGVNPCDGDTLFPEGIKFCDGDNNAFVLRQVPGDPNALNNQNGLSIFDAAPFDVPGLDQLPNFGIPTVANVTQAAFSKQGTDGYFGAPTAAFDVVQVQPQDTLYFNLPVCSFDAVTISAAQRDSCAGVEGQSVEMCISNKFLLCGCPGQALNNVPWPYRTEAAVQCA